MYIKEKDYAYCMNLYKGLDEERKKVFEGYLAEAMGERAKGGMGKIKVIDEEFLECNVVEDREMVTRTIIKKVYRMTKS